MWVGRKPVGWGPCVCGKEVLGEGSESSRRAPQSLSTAPHGLCEALLWEGPFLLEDNVVFGVLPKLPASDDNCVVCGSIETFRMVTSMPACAGVSGSIVLKSGNQGSRFCWVECPAIFGEKSLKPLNQTWRQRLSVGSVIGNSPELFFDGV